MRCLDVQSRLDLYLDGALDPAQAEKVRGHLTACVGCRTELTYLQTVEEALETWPLVAEPADLTARVMAQVEPCSQTPRFRPHWTDLILSLCGAALLAAAGLAFTALRLWQLPVSIDLGLARQHAVDTLRLQTLPLEMMQLEVALRLQPLIESGALMWAAVLTGSVLALILIPFLWLHVPRLRLVRAGGHIRA